jgi:quercetin 2,3-dioxygenase
LLIRLCRSEQRRHVRRGRQEAWLTSFLENPGDPPGGAFGPLELLTEDRLPPGARIPRDIDRDGEIVTYVFEGTLTHNDPAGGSRIVRAGEFERVSAAGRIRNRDRNRSRNDWAHVFQIRLRPHSNGKPGGLKSSREQKRFSAAERRGILCVVASQDGRNGSLCIHQDALIHSALLSLGQHIVHELSHQRSAWLHVVRGEVALGDIVLSQGDGAGIGAAPAVSLTARAESELLLLDLCG